MTRILIAVILYIGLNQIIAVYEYNHALTQPPEHVDIMQVVR